MLFDPVLLTRLSICRGYRPAYRFAGCHHWGDILRGSALPLRRAAPRMPASRRDHPLFDRARHGYPHGNRDVIQLGTTLEPDL